MFSGVYAHSAELSRCLAMLLDSVCLCCCPLCLHSLQPSAVDVGFCSAPIQTLDICLRESLICAWCGAVRLGQHLTVLKSYPASGSMFERALEALNSDGSQSRVVLINDRYRQGAYVVLFTNLHVRKCSRSALQKCWTKIVESSRLGRRFIGE